MATLKTDFFMIQYYSKKVLHIIRYNHQLRISSISHPPVLGLLDGTLDIQDEYPSIF